MSMRDNIESGDEQLEVIERLRNISNGCGALELSLRRNSMGQLGFHVQPDGVVTQVEMNGQAWTAGLRQGYRLVEICKVAVATLSHDQMVDLLKTSVQVTVTVIESFSDFSPRRGCFVSSCKFNAINYEDDYENVDGKKIVKKPAPQIQPTMSHQKRYERNFSPPRSSNSSGYGTGSSSRSFTATNNDQRFVPDMGTLTSSSSGHSSNDERWYDIVEQNQGESKNGTSEQQLHHHPKLSQVSSLPLTQNHSLSPHEGRPLPRQANIELLSSNRQLKPITSEYVSPDTLMKNLHINESDKNGKRPEPIYSVSMKNMNMQVIHQTSLDEEDLNRSNKINDITHLKRSATTNNIQSAAKKAPTATVAPTSSSSSSRNNSPRPLTEAKLRQGVNHRTNNPNYRASVHYSSTLQEDLLKLINPDYLMGSSDDNFHQGGLTNTMMKQQKNSPNSHSLGNLSSNFQTSPLKTAIISDDLELVKKKSRSREGINLGNGLSNGNLKLHKSNGASPDEQIFITTARPATVITSSNSSPAIELMQNSNVLHINEERMKSSPHKQMNGGGITMSSSMIKNKFPILADMKESDWNSLVDTATRAMLQVTLEFCFCDCNQTNR